MKLGKQLAALRRELTANPKKAAVLVLLLAAAAWFWGPIVWRKFGGSTPGPQAQVPSAGLSVASAASNTKPDTRHPQTANWNQLLTARRQDPLTQPAKFDPQWPQPFKVQALGTASTAGTGPVEVLLTPSQAGLVLESIVYGNTRRAAMINGEIYREGTEVAVAAAQGVAVTFQVVHIDRTSVALERYGRTYRLEFPRPKLPQSKPAQRTATPTAPATSDQP